MTARFAHPPAEFAAETEVMGRRMAATLVDALVVFVVFYAGIRVAGGLYSVGPSELVAGFLFWYLFNVLAFAPFLVLYEFSPVWFGIAIGIWAVYGATFEYLFGRTIGKRLFGLVVVSETSEPPTLRAAVVRNLFRYVDGLFFYAVGLFVLAVTGRRQRLGDLAAGTVVTRVAADRTPEEEAGAEAAGVSGR